MAGGVEGVLHFLSDVGGCVLEADDPGTWPPVFEGSDITWPGLPQLKQVMIFPS